MNRPAPLLVYPGSPGPGRVLARHATDQVTDLPVDLQSAGSLAELSSPVELEALAMPLDNGRGLDDDQNRPPALPDA